ncbi:protein DpdG [Paenibacillus sp. LS1]|uniref:protein DpdG n=1 Tax=Paenibacillus sp. LS1 TaxID=2992120 RepID=UPI00222E6B2E|nr:protein DpdG [Paenibacillus sp. LS1]MCW3795386.1 protein DpdG [Paenibacillus sp. LS1]
MSLMKNVQATPSRVSAIYRLTLQMPHKRIETNKLKQLLMPQALANTDRNETDFIGLTIPELIKLNLIEESDNCLQVPENLPKEILDNKQLERALPHVLREKALTSSNFESNSNADLAKIIAWYLSQNPYNAPGSWEAVENALMIQLKDKMDCTSDPRYGQFEDWALYFGFVSRLPKMLFPDPTRVIRHYLPQLFHDKPTHNIDTIVKRLSKLCPVMEMGHYRESLRLKYGAENLKEGHLSQATSFAWMRLEEENIVRLEKKSDADIYLFSENQYMHRYSEITWLREEV